MIKKQSVRDRDRPIYAECANAIEDAGATPASPLKVVKTNTD